MLAEDCGPITTRPERKAVMWVVVPYLDCSGTKVFGSKQEALDFAVTSANEVRGAVWIYEATARTEAAPTAASVRQL